MGWTVGVGFDGAGLGWTVITGLVGGAGLGGSFAGMTMPFAFCSSNARKSGLVFRRRRASLAAFESGYFMMTSCM